MIRIIRTNGQNQDFTDLVTLLNKDLAERDGNDHSFYAQFNGLEKIKNAVVLFEGDVPVACGAYRVYNDDTVEIKRMYVLPEQRRKGLAAQVLVALEQWAMENRYRYCILETGKRQPEAIALYKRCGYDIIPNYDQYANVENSVCMKKQLV